jgi:hypothetical protein
MIFGSNGTGLLHWIFTLNGILSIIILFGMIYLIVTFTQSQKKKKQNNQKKQPSDSQSGQNYAPYQQDNQTAEDKSFWDDFRKSDKNSNPQREEEPIPPNAIPPSTAIPPLTQTMTYQEESKDVNGIWEKDCGKEMESSNVISINKDEKGEQ